MIFSRYKINRFVFRKHYFPAKKSALLFSKTTAAAALDAAANAVVDSYATSLEYTFNNTSNDPYDIAEEYLPVQNNAPLPFDENGEQSLNAIAE